MSLLGDLKLAYETLADDPIEVGIHYGHSILNILSEKASPTQQFAYATIPSYVARDIPIKPRAFRVAVEPSAPAIREVPTTNPSRGQDYSNFIRRTPASRSSVSFADRNLIGAL